MIDLPDRPDRPDRPDSAPSPMRLPLGPLTLGLVGGSVLLAGVAGFGLALLMGASEPWSAALAGALGMALTAVPLGALLLRLARNATPPVLPGLADSAACGAMSRPQFIELAEREWARSRRYGSGAALLLVEVDRHARLLDSFGPAVVEAVLREMIHDTAPTLRGADALARFGDGQLAVFLAHADALGALDVAERIRERTEVLEVPHHPQRLRVTASIGVAHLRPAHLHLQALLDDAGDAVLAARQAGGNCVRAAPVEFGRLASSGPPRSDRRARRPSAGG